MSDRSTWSTNWLRIAEASNPRWALVALCVAVAALPVWGQCAGEQKLTASDAAASDSFGGSVSVSGDTAVVGASDDDDGGTDSGSAYVYVRIGGVWTLQQKLTASDADAGDGFGASVSISGDTAVVGAHYDVVAGTGVGSAYVFVRSGGVWIQQQKLTASDAAASDNFGIDVSLSGDTAVVGAIGDDHAGVSEAGSAYVFVRTGGVWIQEQKLTASDAAAQDFFGLTVSVSGDTVLVGASTDNGAGGNSGSAYVFVRSDGVWTQQQELTGSDAATNDRFGVSVSVSGEVALVGAFKNDDAGADSGSAYVFVRSGGVWTQQQKLTASDAAAGDSFGVSVSLSGDTALVGAWQDDDAGVGSGSAYVFTHSGGVWNEQLKRTAADASQADIFGASVSVSGDTAVIGASGNDPVGLFNAGSVYAFQCIPLCSPTDCSNHGTCVNGTCLCDDSGFIGASCNQCTTDSICDDAALCTLDGCDAGSCANHPIRYADVNSDGFVNVSDTLCLLDTFAGNPDSAACFDGDSGAPVAFEAKDLAPCPTPGDPRNMGDGFLNVSDVLTTLDVFAAVPQDPACNACAGGP